MKKFTLRLLLATGAILLSALPSHAWNLKDLLGKAQETIGNNSDVTNIIDGLLGTSDFDIASLEGTWEVTGSAIDFGSEDALSKIGGKAAKLAIEKKLDPYYKQYGLTGSSITFDAEGNFSLSIKRITITGYVTKGNDGKFITTFTALGKTRIADMATFFEKGATGQTLSIMWDARKALNVLQTVASLTKAKTASALSSLLNQYDDMYLGFRLNKVK